MESAAIARRFVEGLNTFDLTAVRTMLTTGPHRAFCGSSWTVS